MLRSVCVKIKFPLWFQSYDSDLKVHDKYYFLFGWRKLVKSFIIIIINIIIIIMCSILYVQLIFLFWNST